MMMFISIIQLMNIYIEHLRNKANKKIDVNKIKIKERKTNKKKRKKEIS